MYYEKRKNNSFATAIILAFLIAIMFMIFSLMQKIEKSFLREKEETKLAGTDSVLAEFSLKDLAKNSSYAIVGISKLNEKNTSVFTQDSEEKLGIGSGIILTSNGYILSNYETTGDIGNTCFVTMKNGNVYPAEVKWANFDLDISIIKISADNLLYLTMGDSSRIEIGDKFYILSNSTGYDFNENLTDVLISKAVTTLKIYDEFSTQYAEDVIKTSLNIEYINNGGAMLNEAGEVLGIASKKLNAVIPINRIKNVLERLKEDGNYKEAYLGIFGFDNSSLKYLVQDYPLKLGIYVDKVSEDSPCSGQIFAGDIITKIDEYELSTFQELSEYLYLKSPKDRVNLSVVRGTKELTVPVILK